VSDAILIVGYYRSGTSALSGALHRLGVSLHNDAEPNEHNPLGFYEIPELIEFDVDLFARLGVAWTDVRGLPDRWWDRADVAGYRSRLEEILRRRFAEAPLWGLKHPHLCRLLPLYERAVTQAGANPRIIHICRDPWTVAASQQRKNGLSRAHAVLLWLTYMLAAERNARHLPRAWLTYEALLASPAAQLRRIEQDLGIPLLGRVPDGVAAAAGFLSGQLNRASPLPQTDLAVALRRLTADVWDAINARDFAPALWDGFAADTAEFTGLIGELGESRGQILPGLIAAPPAVAAGPTEAQGLRPAERLDDGAKRRLLARRDAAGPLPTVSVIVVAPPARAHAVNDTLNSLRQQWHPAAEISILSVDPVEIPGIAAVMTPGAAGAITAALCARLNGEIAADYVAILNAGDTVAPDACLRFALTAAEHAADLIYCDEIVPSDQGGWIRHKPAWDVTRLRQSAYLGDWVWYRAETIRRRGGFDAGYAGAEEYEFQLRLADSPACVVRLPEPLFSRAALSRRDNIPATAFGPRAQAAVAAHLRRAGIGGAVEPRQYLGLFRHVRAIPDPGTAVILLCSHADVEALDRWMNILLGGEMACGPIIMVGAGLLPATESYLAKVADMAETLAEKVAAVAPAPGLTVAAALRAALSRITAEHVLILDAAAIPATPDWAEALRARFADPAVALAAGRALIPLPKDQKRFVVQGAIIRGADTRLGAGHFADDPGPGGWLAVDQEASAVAPPILLARHAALAACVIPDLAGDALWIDLCAQIRATGARLVWTPDVSFIVPPETIQPDPECRFRDGTAAARSLGWEDPYHHPALALHGDTLAMEPRFGLIAAEPRLGLVAAEPRLGLIPAASYDDVLLSGPADAGLALLNAARALRGTGRLEASWAPEPLRAVEIGRRAAHAWVRIDPDTPAASPYIAVFTAAPPAAAIPAILAARRLVATSPSVVARFQSLAPGLPVTLWRPALSRPVWTDLTPASGLNTKPRILWIDEGAAPPWLPDLINETRAVAAWIVVERPGVTYAGDIARIRAPEDEQGWARELAALAPHILVRPTTRDDLDCYKALLAAAAGCHLLIDSRLDLPPELEPVCSRLQRASTATETVNQPLIERLECDEVGAVAITSSDRALGPVRLPNQPGPWRAALLHALADFAGTLEHGRRSRAACLALPSVEAAPPPWAEPMLDLSIQSAAE